MSGINPRFDFTAARVALTDLGTVHFIAIGGSGMSAVATLLADAGLAVSGCDAVDGAAAARLRASGTAVATGHDPGHLQGIDTVVVSSAVPETLPELAAARAAGLRVLHRSQALAAAMGSATGIAVAGANGKTTTSAMIVSALRAAGADPSFAIGAELVDTGTNAHLGAGAAFVVEADESDGSFLSYRPSIAVVTNVQPDHLDFYGDFAHVERAYAAFAASMDPSGLLVTSADDPGAQRLAATVRASGARVVSVGDGPGADLRLEGVRQRGLTGSATVHDRASGARFDLNVAAPGRHNIDNAAAAFAVGWLGCGLDPVPVLAGLAAYPGTRRRFERRGEAGGVTVVDDYAHNGAKVRAVVTAARDALAGTARLHVVFQPHLYSRTRDFAAEFAAGLAPADDVVLLPVYGARETPMAGVTSELIAAPLRHLGTAVAVVDGPAAAIAHLVTRARPGDLILTVGAGDVTRIGDPLLAALASGGSV